MQTQLLGAVALPTLLLLLSSTLTGHLEFLKHPSQSANKPDQQTHYSSTLSTCSTLHRSCGQRLFPYYIILFILCEDKERSTEATGPDYSLQSGKSRSLPLDDRIPARSPSHISYLLQVFQNQAGRPTSALLLLLHYTASSFATPRITE
jgi:hypothetical protein